MRRKLERTIRDEKGMAYVLLLAALLMGMLGLGAIAVDVGVLLTARSEAQRTAEASAHAGAMEFMFAIKPENSVIPAAQRSLQYAGNNNVRFQPIDATAGTSSWQGSVFLQPFNEGLIEVLRDSLKVRTRVNRTVVPTIFGRFVDVNSWSIGAMAAAQVTFAGTARCVKPFAVPDRWYDENGNFYIGSNEPYARFDQMAPEPPVQTGYGSAFRNNPTYAVDGRTNPEYDPQVQEDIGRRVRLRAGNQETTPSPSMYFHWDLPPDPEISTANCPGGAGGSLFHREICHCNNSEIVLGQTYSTSTGAQMGIIRQGLNSLVAQDPGAQWDPINKVVTGSLYDPWWNSPRVATVALFDPRPLLEDGSSFSGRQDIVFNNFASIFIEPLPSGSGQNDDVYGRFIPRARGARGSPNGNAGTLVRMLQIVE
jgi:hypothetical protein